ncbi:NUDIX domain-containing protein [Providencia alcalifaciens]|uniref:NUDIX domain protein n=1 Tax=Providencia alcalifaciens 205/92 TaxID=1256988 RepID=A0AAV3M1C8_9GAMM|nr:NUDIX domain-containing protein [Providencia alcalifaciens]EUD09573.1 NUDIX domain protein [Providencia alcalifaciens 205/92]WGZ53867.1 NUDIX domain-containing protein [Providencia alcalifaciens]
MEQVKHFTATAMICNRQGEFLLHEHPKLGIWLPPGGHVDPNEGPQEAVVREVLEETRLHCKVIDCRYPLQAQVNHSGQTDSLPIPLAILKERIADKHQGEHWHIDMVYLCELLESDAQCHTDFHWVSLHQMRHLNLPNDVYELAIMVNEFYQEKRLLGLDDSN